MTENDSVSIAIGSRGISISNDAKAIITEPNNMAEKGQPQPTVTTSLPDAPDLCQLPKAMAQLRDKAIYLGFQKLIGLLEGLDSKASASVVTDILMKLLDSKSADEWSVAFRDAILRNPKLISPGASANGDKTNSARNKAGALGKIAAGDGRTTPVKLLNHMPKDEVA